MTQKALEFPAFAKALLDGDLRVGHAGRIVSKLTSENVVAWVEFAKNHTFAEITERVANSNPGQMTRETKKRIAGDQTRYSFVASDRLEQKLERAQALLAQRNKACKLADAIEAMCDSFLRREDPVEKAKRSEKRPTKVTIEQKPESNVRTGGRVPFVAAEKHAVHLKSGGRCMYSDHHGRCKEQRHLAIHHIKAVSEGGTNDPDNLVHICWHHHDWIHQLSFPGMEMPWTFVTGSES